MTRDEHLAWCKSRALEYVDCGKLQDAVASMLSDLREWDEPLYTEMAFNVIAMDGMMFCKTADQVRHWIEGFN